MCYVYLADVDLNPLPKEVFSNRDTRISWFLRTRGSRWYERGWTLQELLAPESVHFFNKHWIHLGSKKDFVGAINVITGIETDILDNSVDIFRCSVAERMSWAANRTTTRKEDMAYCLMGIMDINMPLLYGEGGERAFLRLQQEILATTDDQSIFAWSSPDTTQMTWRGLLASSPKEFAGCPKFSIADHADSRNPDCHMTPRGIRITLSVQPPEERGSSSYPSNEYLAVLFCRPSSASDKNIAIRLMKVYGNVFVRVDCATQQTVPKSSIQKTEQLTLIIPQDLKRKWWGRWECTRIGGLELVFDHQVTISQVDPLDSWNQKSYMWKLSDGRSSVVSCAIQFTHGPAVVFEAVFDRSKTDYKQQIRTKLYAKDQRRERTEPESKESLGVRVSPPELRWDSERSYAVISLRVSYKGS
jgi:hypothetical protein